MLNENQNEHLPQNGEVFTRYIKPEDVVKNINFQDYEYVLIMAQPKNHIQRQETQLWFSTMTVNEMAFLQTQFQAHCTCHFGLMREMPDDGK